MPCSLCTNRLAQPAIIGPNSQVAYRRARQALDGNGDVATGSQAASISVVRANGATTATLDASLGRGGMDCQ